MMFFSLNFLYGANVLTAGRSSKDRAGQTNQKGQQESVFEQHFKLAK